MADFWSNYAALGIPLAPERDESVARLERMIGQKRLSSGVMAGEAPGMGYRVAQSIPFLGSAGTALHGHEIEQAQKRISEGKGTDRDFSIVSDAFVDAEAQQNQSFGQDVLQGGMATTGYMAELAATGGLASGAIGARAGAGLASRVGVGAADLAVGTAASGQWLPHAQRYGADSYGTRLNEETNRQEYQRVAEGDPLMEALGKGYARAALTRVVETLGGEAVATGGRVAGRMAANLPGVGAVAGGAAGVVDAIGSAPWLANVKIGLGKAWEKATGKGAVELREVLEKGAGWSNLIGEIGEERLEEVLAGATGLEDDYGMTGRAAQIVGEKAGLVEPKEGGGESGGDFLRDFLVELAVLGASGGGMKGVSAGAALLDDPGVNAELGRRFDAAFTGIENAADRVKSGVVDTLFPRTESSIPERTIEGPAGEMPPFPTAESRPVQPAAESDQVLTVNTSEPSAPSSIAEKVNAGRPLSRREAEAVGGAVRSSTEQRQELSDRLRAEAAADAQAIIGAGDEAAGNLWMAVAEGTLTDDAYQEITGKAVPYAGYAEVVADAVTRQQSGQVEARKTPADPMSMTEDEFSSRAIPDDKATELVARIRSGDSRSRHQGVQSRERSTGPLVEASIPITTFSDEQIQYLRESTDPDRVKRYASENIDAPIYAPVNRRGKIVVSDGGHRLLAAIDRGDTSVRALVPPKAYGIIRGQVEAKEVPSGDDDAPAPVVETPPAEPEAPKPRRRKRSVRERAQDRQRERQAADEISPHSQSTELNPKEPWEMTRAEYAERAAKRVSGMTAGKNRKLASDFHKQFVRKALEEGKTVPPEVLESYPGLADQYPQGKKVAKSKPKPVEQSPVAVDDAAFRELQREEERARKAWTKGMDQFPVGSPELHELASKVFAAREAVDKAAVARADAAKGAKAVETPAPAKPVAVEPKPEGPDFRELAREAVANNENVRGLFKRHGLSMRKDRDLSLAVGDEINRLRSEQERESPGRKSAVMADPQDYKTGVEGAVVQAMRAMAHAGTRGDYSLVEIVKQVPGYRPADIGKAVGNLIKAGELEGVKGPGLRVGRSQLSAVRAPKIDAEYEARKSGSAARKPVAKTASADRVEDLLAAIRRIEPGANRGALVAFRDLRKEFPELSKEQFDRMVLKASADGVMAIHRHDYPSSLTQPERDAMVTNGTDYFIGGSLRRDSGPAVMGEPLADPDMERARQVIQMESDGVPVGTSSVLESQRKAQVVVMEGKNPRRAGGTAPTKAEREKQERVRREREKKAYGTRGERHEPKRTNAPSGHVVPYSRVVERLIKAFDRLGVSLEVHTGRMQPTTRTMAAGHFMPQSGVARISRSGNIVTIFHEAGHALEAKVLIGRGKFVGVGGQRAMNMIRNTPLKGLTPEVEADLVGLAQLLYKKEPLNGWRSEGIAELFQKWVLDTKRLEAFPHAKEWMETHVLGLDKKFASDMRKAQDLGHKWWRMSNVEAVESQVKRAEWRDVVDRVRRYFRENPIIDTMFESYMPLRQMEIEAAKIRGVEKPTEKQTPIYNRAKALRRADNAIARRMLYENMVSPTGQVVGPSLRGLLRDAELTYADREKVGLYLYVRRGLALWNDPNGPRDPGVGREVLEGAYAELSQDPRLEVFAQGWDTWNEQLLDYMAALSPRMAMNVARMRQLDPGAYAPLEAWFESWEDTPLGSSANQVNVATGDVSKRLRGSGRRRRDPLESIISIVADRVGAAHDRNIMEMAIELAARTPDLGKWVHQVPVEQMTVAERSVHDVLAKVVKKASGDGMDRGASGWQLTNDSGEVIDLDAALDQLVAFHAPAVSPVGPDARYLQPFIDGQGNLTWWRFEPRLLNAISKGGQRSTKTGVALFDALVDFWAYSNLVIKMFQVGLNQSFLLITQPLRDIKTAPSRTRSDSWMPRVMGEFLWDYVQGGASAIVGDRYESRLLELYKNLGLEVTAPLRRDWAATIRTSRGLFRVWDPKKNTGANFLELLRNPGQAAREGGSRVMEYTMNLGQWTDRVPRIGEMRRVLQQNGWDIDNLTMEQRVLLAMAAKEVTQDNTAGGHFTGIFNKLLMYHRAWAQGVRGSVAAVHRNPMRALGNQALFLALNVGLWLENRDDEEWRNLAPYRKWSNYFFGFDYGGRKEYLVIPAEQDMETAFVMGTTAMLDAWYHQDPQSAVEWARHFAMLNMPVMPGLLSEIWEQRGNHDSFTDQAIVPDGLRWMSPEAQYDEYTTMVAYWLGQTLGWSPKRIDHALHGVFARTGKGLMTGAFGTVGRDPWWKTWLTGEDQSTREGELADTFIFGKLFQAGGAIGSRPESVGKIFDLAREAEARAAGARAGQGKPMTDVERQRHYLLRAAGSRMKGYFDAKKAAYKSVDRDAISREMVRDAEQVLERLKTLEGE